MYADNNWAFFGLKKDGNTFTVYINGNSVYSLTVANTSLGSKDLYIGQFLVEMAVQVTSVRMSKVNSLLIISVLEIEQ